jgi:hypothetical protein
MGKGAKDVSYIKKQVATLAVNLFLQNAKRPTGK